ncbi:MAG: hypothetical protein ACJAS3_003622 [Roseivirga sp.]|jgi:hypothetical protein
MMALVPVAAQEVLSRFDKTVKHLEVVGDFEAQP